MEASKRGHLATCGTTASGQQAKYQLHKQSKLINLAHVGARF